MADLFDDEAIDLIHRISTQIRETTKIISTLDTLITLALDSLEETHPDVASPRRRFEFGKRPSWTELAMSNVLEYMYETGDAWDEMFVKLNKEEYQK